MQGLGSGVELRGLLPLRGQEGVCLVEGAVEGVSELVGGDLGGIGDGSLGGGSGTF